MPGFFLFLKIFGISIGTVVGSRCQNVYICASKKGELPEWSIGADSKSVVPFGVPGVRIPRSPHVFGRSVFNKILVFFVFVQLQKKERPIAEPPLVITPKINP